jgi:hypothetical protein
VSLQQRPRGCTTTGQYDVGAEDNQFRRVFANALGIARAPADVDANVATVGPAQLRQRLCERQYAPLRCRIIRRETHEQADAPHALALLRTRRERPRGRRAAEQRDEGAPCHSITSSARASTLAGISMPSALAVLRLITQLILGWRLHRKFGRLLALENTIDIGGPAPVRVGCIRPIGD